MGALTRGRALGLGTLTAVLAMAIVLLSSSLAFGKGNPPPAPPPEGGVLRLDLGWHQNRFIFQEQGAEDLTQHISVHRCAATLGGPDDLVTLGAEGPDGSTPSLAWSGLAVKQAKYDKSCKAVSGDEVLTFGLSAALSEKLIEFGELDIEAKRGTRVLFEMLLDGKLVASQEFSTSDASTYTGRRHDNYRVIVEPGGGLLYNQLRLSVVDNSGWFRWEAGTDGTPKGPLGQALRTRDSVFQLTDAQLLGCDPLTVGKETDGPAATVTRTDGGCDVSIPVVFRSGTDDDQQFVSLEKDPEAVASFEMTIVWDPEAPMMPVPATRIDFADGQASVQWCDDSNEGAPDWCLTSQATELTEGGMMVVTETYRGEGDPRWAR